MSAPSHQPEPERRNADLPGPDRTEAVTVAAGVELHTRRWDGHDRGGDDAGPGAGHPVVLVHGLASNARLWDGVAAHLAGLGHPVAAIDQRGHGRSSKPDHGYGLTTVTDDLHALVAHVVDTLSSPPTAPPVVVGQSWGGNVVVELAARFPGLTAGIVAVDGGAIHLSRQFPDWDECAEALAPPPLAGTPAADVEAMLRSRHPDWPESGIQGALACFEVRDDATIAPWLTRDRHLLVLRGLWEHQPPERFPLVREPVLFLNARTAGADPEWQASKRRGMADAETLLSDATVEWILGDHDLHAQHPVATADRIHAFALAAGR